MSLTQTTISYPIESIYKQAIGQFFFQQSFDAAFASYDPHSFVIHGYPPHVPSESSGKIDALGYIRYLEDHLKQIDSAQSQLGFLLKETAWSHEIKHFHDSVCTPAGWIAFAREWTLYLQIYKQLRQFREEGRVLTQSFLSYYQEGDSTLGELFNLYSNIAFYRVLMNGDLPPVVAELGLTANEVVWLESTGAFGPVRIPSFPANAMVDGKKTCLLLPFGFRALTECGAVLVQNHIIRSIGQEYVDAHLGRLRPFHEYRVANLLFTKVLKNRGIDPNKDTWASGELFRIIQATLSHPVGYNLQNSPASVFIDNLESRIDSATGKFDGSHDENLRRYLEFQPEAKEITFAGEFDGDWYFYQIRNFALSCFSRAVDVFTEKKESDPYPVDSIEWYSVHNHLLPQPPVSVRGGDLGILPGVEGVAFAKHSMVVVAWVIFRVLTEQAALTTELRCPVHEGPYKDFLQAVEPHSHCREGVLRGDCGRAVMGSDVSKHWDCPWKKMLVDCGIGKG